MNEIARDPAAVLGRLERLEGIGCSRKRREDPRLIRGRGTYVDDIALVGMLHIAFKRSDVAHGRREAVLVGRRQAVVDAEHGVVVVLLEPRHLVTPAQIDSG